MDLHTWFLFVTVAMVAILSPGPAILLAINNSIQYDMKAVALSTLGNSLGLFTLSGAAMLGLGVVLKTSAVFFLTFKIVGSLYLIYMGIKQFRNRSNIFDTISFHQKKTHTEYFAIFRRGFLVCITNPKPIVFFTALFPIFLNTHVPLMPQFLILTLTFMVLSYSTIMLYALFARSVKSWFKPYNRAVWFNRISGSLFVLLGFGLLGLKRQ